MRKTKSQTTQIFNTKIKQYEKDFRSDVKGGIENLTKEIIKCAEMYIYFERMKKGFFITNEDKKIKAMEVCEYIIEQYLTRANFSLKVPTAYIRLRVLAVLYPYIKKIDKKTIYTDEGL